MSISALYRAVNAEAGVGLLSAPREFSRKTGESFQRRVLVVDHEPLIRWSLAETLTEAGHAVVLAADRMAALEAVTAGPPFDVVLLDGDLPGSCDLSLLSCLRALAPSARIILMTAFGSPALERSALSVGASLVIGKPFDMEDLPAFVA